MKDNFEHIDIVQHFSTEQYKGKTITKAAALSMVQHSGGNVFHSDIVDVITRVFDGAKVLPLPVFFARLKAERTKNAL